MLIKQLKQYSATNTDMVKSVYLFPLGCKTISADTEQFYSVIAPKWAHLYNRSKNFSGNNKEFHIKLACFMLAK